MTQTAQAQYVLDIDPEGAQEELRYYDAATFLLARVETRRNDGVRVTENFSDYRPVFGAMRAFHWSYTQSIEAAPQSGDVISFTTDNTGTSLQPPQSRVLFSIPPGQSVDLPAKFTSRGIMVTVGVQDQKLQFLLDTGASPISIDPGTLSRMGIASQGRRRERIAGDVDRLAGHRAFRECRSDRDARRGI